MRLEHFEALVRTRRLYFSYIDDFADENEGSLTEEDRMLEAATVPETHRVRQETRDHAMAFTGCHCWTMAEVELGDMWIGSNHEQPRQVAIRSTWSRLYHSIRFEGQLDMRLIEYSRRPSRLRVANVLAPAFRKEPVIYEAEREVRLCGYFLNHGVFDAPPAASDPARPYRP